MHPLTPFQVRVVGVRHGNLPMAVGEEQRGPPGELCRLGIRDVVEGVVVSVPRLPGPLLEDQDAALELMVLACQDLEVDAVGLGSLLAVVAGRGEALAARLGVPVTTGGAATAWAALRNTQAVLKARGEKRCAVLGFSGAVGQCVAELLVREGVEVVAGGAGKPAAKRASALGIRLVDEEEAVAEVGVVVGAATTGGTLDPSALKEGATLLDVALPPTLKPGPLPRGARVQAAEGLSLPPGWQRGGWGSLYHVVSGYGLRRVLACLVEPLAMAVERRKEPFSLGRRVEPDQAMAFGEVATALGFKPVLGRHLS